MSNRFVVIHALHTFICQRPGLEFGNYGDSSAYRSEARRIARDSRDARTMLHFVAVRDGIKADDIVSGIGSAFSGRLQWNGKGWDYTAGQYWPTEYRRAACVGLARVVCNWLRTQCGCDTYEKVQSAAKRELGRSIAKRWFN